MKDIKTKEHNRSPKVLTKSSRMPKQLVKKSILEAKEKSMEGSRISDGSQETQTATGYAGNKIETVSKRTAKTVGEESVKVSYAAGRKAAQKTYQKLRKKEKETNTDSQETDTSGRSRTTNDAGTDNTGHRRNSPEKERERGKHQSSRPGETTSPQARTTKTLNQNQQPMIRTRETVRRTVKTKGTQGAVSFKGENLQALKQFSIKKAPRVVKSSPAAGFTKRGRFSTTARPAGKEMRTAKLARQRAVVSMQQNAARIQHSANATVRFKRFVEAAAKTVRSAIAALAAGGGAMFLVLIIIVGVVGGVFSYSASQSSASLSPEVLSYTSTIQNMPASMASQNMCP